MQEILERSGLLFTGRPGLLVRATAVPRRRRGKSCLNHRDLRKRGRYFSDLDLRSRVSDDFRPPARRDGSKHILAGVWKRTGPTEGSVKRLSRRGLQFDSKPWWSAAPRGGRPQSSSSASPSALRLVDNPSSRVFARRVCREMPRTRAAWTWLPLVERRTSRKSSRSSF
jgi:hypothetical protein